MTRGEQERDDDDLGEPEQVGGEQEVDDAPQAQRRGEEERGDAHRHRAEDELEEAHDQAIFYDCRAGPMQTRELAIDGNRTEAHTAKGSARRIWLLLADPLPNRIFFDCGIVDALREALPGRLTALFLVHEKHVRPWRDRLEGLPVVDASELMPVQVPFAERVSRRIDIELDRRAGFYPLAVRQSMREGFHEGRWLPGHRNTFLDSDRVGPLPRWEPLDRLLTKRHFSAVRYTPAALLERMRAECDGLVVTNLQAQSAMPFLTAARRLGLPVVGYVASWDHTVGKGVVSPHLSRYVVQSQAMRDDLERYHGIDPSRVSVTGWPQSDVYTAVAAGRLRGAAREARPRPGEAASCSTRGTRRRTSPTRRTWSGGSWTGGRRRRPRAVPAPLPAPSARQPGAGALRRGDGPPGRGRPGASYTDLNDLVKLLQHVACVVANGGTVLLDGLANDRPAVCITYDEWRAARRALGRPQPRAAR